MLKKLVNTHSRLRNAIAILKGVAHAHKINPDGLFTIPVVSDLPNLTEQECLDEWQKIMGNFIDQELFEYQDRTGLQRPSGLKDDLATQKRLARLIGDYFAEISQDQALEVQRRLDTTADIGQQFGELGERIYLS